MIYVNDMYLKYFEYEEFWKYICSLFEKEIYIFIV